MPTTPFPIYIIKIRIFDISIVFLVVDGGVDILTRIARSKRSLVGIVARHSFDYICALKFVYLEVVHVSQDVERAIEQGWKCNLEKKASG